jgi:hypothetical protein
MPNKEKGIEPNAALCLPDSINIITTTTMKFVWFV